MSYITFKIRETHIAERKIQLNDNQATEFHSLSTDSARESYLNSITDFDILNVEFIEDVPGTACEFILHSESESTELQSDDIDANEYVANGGLRCPFCKSDHIEGGQFEVDAGIAWQPIVCNSCGRDWNDQYSLTHLNINRRD